MPNKKQSTLDQIENHTQNNKQLLEGDEILGGLL